MSAIAQLVALPTETLSDLSGDVDRLAATQAEIAELERRAKQLRARVREAMESRGVDSFVSSGGHTASLFTTTRWMADRKKALAQFSAEVVAAIFRPQTSTTLRVK